MPDTDYFPEFSNYIPTYIPNRPAPSSVPLRPASADVPATGTGDWFTSGVMAGFHGALSEGARALQAGAQLAGSHDMAKSLSDFAEAAHAREQSYARPDLEGSWSPAGIGYKIARMVPLGIGAVGTGAAAAAAFPEVAGAGLLGAVTTRGLGAAAALFPSAAGANVERQISETGELTSPGTALALGVPEAAIQALLPGHLEKFFGRGILRGVAHSAAALGVAGGSTEAMTQLVGDPDRGFADRASAIVSQALSGAALGGLVGGVGGTFGGMRSLAGKPAPKIPTADLGTSVDQALNPPEQLPLPLPRVPEGLKDLPLFARQPAEAPVAATEAPAAAAVGPEPGQLPLPLPQVPEGLQDLPLFARRPEAASAVPPAAHEPAAPVVPAPEVPRGEPAVPASDVPPAGAPAPGEPSPVVAPAAAAPVPVLDFTKGAVKAGGALYKETTPEIQAAMRQPLIDAIIARAAEGQEPTKLQVRWADELDIWGELEKAVSARPLETPPGVTPEAPGAAAPPAGLPERGPLAREVAPQHMPWYDEGYAGRPRGGNEAEQAAWDRGANDRMMADRAREAPVVPAEPPAVAPAVPAEPHPLDIPEFLRRAPATPVARDVPIKTADDRAAALNGVQAEIAKLPDSEAKNQHITEARRVEELLPLAEDNPGLVPKLNDRVDNLRAAVEAARTLPADHVAPDLAPSPRAEATSAPMGDLNVKVKNAQRELTDLREVLGGRSGAPEALEAHDQWLRDVLKAAKTADPEELRSALAAEPTNLANLKQISKPMQAQVNGYLATQKRVIQELQAQSNSRARVISSRDGLPVTQLDADVTDMHQRGVPLTDVADHIIEHIVDPEQAEIVAKLKPFLPEDAKTVFRDGVVDKEGEYFPKQQTSALYNAANATATAIHEMVHAVMHKAIDGASAAAEAVRGIYDQLKSKGDHAGITDAHEMVAEAFANPVYRDFLKANFVKGTSLWDRFVDAVRGFIGLDPRLFNALDRIMSLGDDLMKEQQQFPNDWVGPDSYARLRGLKAAANGADQGREATVKRLVEGGKFNTEYALRSGALGWTDGYRIARLYGPAVESMLPYADALSKVETRDGLLSKASQTAYNMARALPEDVRELMHKVQQDATFYGFDPRKPAPLDITENPGQLKLYQELAANWNQLRNTKGGEAAYEMQRASASADYYKVLSDRLQTLARAIPDVNVPNPFDAFDQRAAIWTDPRKVEAHFKQDVEDKLKFWNEYRDQLADPKIKGEVSADDMKMISSITSVLKEVTTRRDAAEKVPYFHLGRNGNFFATAKLALDSEGNVDPEKLAKLSEFLDRDGHTGIAMMLGGQHDTMYTRVQSPAEANALYQSLLKAQKQGLLSREEAPGSGEATKVFPLISTEAMRKVVEAMPRPDIPEGLSNAAEIEKAFNEQRAELQRTLLNTMAENSIGRILARRANVQGFSKDMSESSFYASKVMNRSLAHMTVAPEIGALMQNMSDEIKQLNRDPEAIKSGLNLAASQAVGEFMLRDRLRTAYVPPNATDTIRHLTHTASVGSSPMYFLTLMSQLMTTAWPELVKTHGYVQGTQALFKAMPDAMRVVSAVLKSPDWATAGITLDALKEDGVDSTLINKTTRMISSGALGPMYSTQMTQHSPLAHGISGTVLKASNAMGLYAELIPRLAAGFAAHDLYNIEPYTDPKTGNLLTRDQFVRQATDESQGRWNANLNARQLTKGGMFGPLSPFVNQFMGWQVRMGGKIYNEVRNLFDENTRPEATRWLIGHGAATTMLAGTLGLPLLSMAASVYDRLMDWVTNRDDHDLTASYRSFLSDTFGKDMGEIIARGLPRAVGMDFAHFGEANIFPGSATINIAFEKRKLEDAERDWFKSMAGPGVGEVSNLLAMVRDMSNGDYLNGMIKMFPEIVKAPAEAYRLHERGFVNNLTGQKLPISGPGAYDIMLTALGIDPAKQAEYQEVTREETGLRTMRQLNSSNIVRHLEQAWTRSDQGMFNTWMSEAQKWQADHPGLMPPQADFGRALETHLRASAQAQGMGLPIGVTPRDVGARGALRYGNFPVQ